MKYFKSLFILCVLSMTIACSSDDDNNSNTQNILKVGDETYPIASAFIETRNDNTILNFQNKSESEVMNFIENGVTLNDFNYSSVLINQSPLASGMYGLTEITEYEVILDATLNEGELNEGIVVLEDDSATISATAIDATIHSITDTFIDISITFLRQDGEEIKISYSGAYFSFPDSSID